MVGIRDRIKGDIHIRPEYFVYVIMVLFILAAGIVSPGYLQLTHMAGILKLAAFMGIAAIGQNCAILLGEIDMSVANTITLGNVIGAQILMGSDTNLGLAFIIVILSGAAVGGLNALGIRYLKLNPFIMTLGMNSVIQGIFMIYTQGAPKGKSSPIMTSLCKSSGMGFLSGVTTIWIVLAVIMIFVLRKTTFGREVYAVGSGRIAAKFSGINVSRVISICYIISGVMAAFTGLLLVGYTGSSYLDVGLSYNNSTIAAVIIGGTAITGGRGGYVGTIAGVIMMIVLEDFLTIVSIPESGKQVIQGLIIIVLLLIYNRDKKAR